MESSEACTNCGKPLGVSEWQGTKRPTKSEKAQRGPLRLPSEPYDSHMIATWQESEVVPSRNPQLGHQGHHGAIGAIDAIQGIQGIQGMQHRGRATCATCATWLYGGHSWATTTDNNWQQLHQVQRQLVGFLGFRGFLGFLGFPVTLLILFEEQKQYFHQNYLDTSCYEVDLQLVMNSTRCVTRCIHMCQIGCSVVDGAVLLFKVSNGYLELWKRFARHFEMVHRCM